MLEDDIMKNLEVVEKAWEEMEPEMKNELSQ